MLLLLLLIAAVPSLQFPAKSYEERRRNREHLEICQLEGNFKPPEEISECLEAPSNNPDPDDSLYGAHGVRPVGRKLKQPEEKTQRKEDEEVVETFQPYDPQPIESKFPLGRSRFPDPRYINSNNKHSKNSKKPNSGKRKRNKLMTKKARRQERYRAAQKRNGGKGLPDDEETPTPKHRRRYPIPYQV